MAATNLNIVKGMYQALSDGDVASVVGALDPQVAWTEAEGFPYAGTYVGPDQVVEGVFKRRGEEWEDFAVVPEEFIDGGETIVSLGRYTGAYKATRKSFSARYAHVWKLSNSKVVRFEQIVYSAKVQEALGGEA